MSATATHPGTSSTLDPPETDTGVAAGGTPVGGAESQYGLQRAVLLTLAYSDVFSYPLRAEEVWRDLVTAARPRDVASALDSLVPTAVSRLEGDFFCLRGREHIGAIRRARAETADDGWRQAHRFSRWLARVPFVRMVAVCGSLAVDNAGADGDVDLFLITAPGRLWLVQCSAMILRRLAWRPGSPPFCPNYLLSESELAVGPQNLYIAHEITQARPLLGQALYRRFRQANAWTDAFLPQARLEGDATEAAAARGNQATELPPSRLQRVLERGLSGRVGEWLDASIHRLLLHYYRFRLRRHGWSLDEIARAYRRDRQTVVTGGYLGAIEARFIERAERLPTARGLPAGETVKGLARRIFRGEDRRRPGDAPRGPAGGDALYAGILGKRYGDDR